MLGLLKAAAMVVALGWLWPILPSFGQAPQGAAEKPDARQRGHQVFLTAGCTQCHSIDGVGGHRAVDLSEVGGRLSASRIRSQIVHGTKDMPPFGEVLSQDQVTDLVTFLRSCRGPSRSTR
jgi:mono/diheme cytochrome c family protein